MLSDNSWLTISADQAIPVDGYKMKQLVHLVSFTTLLFSYSIKTIVTLAE